MVSISERESTVGAQFAGICEITTNRSQALQGRRRAISGTGRSLTPGVWAGLVE